MELMPKVPRIRCLLAAVMLLFGNLAAHATDNYAQGVLSIPTITIGSMTLTNLDVTVASIVSGPTGSAPLSGGDAYDPATQVLSVASVQAGGTTYYNVAIVVGDVVSIGDLSGGDTYDGNELTLSRVQIGSVTGAGLIVTVGDVLGVAGGMPESLLDSYDPASGILEIAAVSVGGRVYTNVAVTLASLISVGTGLQTPVLTQLQPAAGVAGSDGAPITVLGSGFVTTSVVDWNGYALPTTYVSASELTAQIPAVDLAVPGSATVQVFNFDLPFGISQQLPYTVQPAPVPVLSGLSPSTAPAGATGFSLTVSGSNFTPTSVVQWNGNPRTTTYVSASVLDVQVTAADLAAVAYVPVTVLDPASSNVASNALDFTVVPTTPPTLTKLSPVSVPAGSAAFTLTVVGTNFVQGSTIYAGGSALPTTFDSPTVLLAAVPATLVQSISTAQISVVNPGVTHFSSNLLTLSVVAASIDAVAYQINPGHSGVMQFSSVTLPGSSAWSASLGGPPSYALIAGGRVYVSTEIGSPGSTITWKLFAFNGKDGSVAWGPLTFSGAVGLAYDGGKLFVTSGQYFQSAVLSALDPATGNTLWSVTVPNPESFASGGPPVAAQGIVYTQETGYVTAFDETTGTQLWQSENFSGTSGSIAVGLDGVYSSGPCTAFDFRPLTGETIWDATTGCDGGGGITPVLGYGRLYAPLAVVTNNTTPYSGNIYGAGTGSLLGNFAYGNSPAVSPSNTYAVTGGTLQSVSNTTGLVNWSFAGDQGLQTAPIIVNNDLFVGSSSGNLYTLDATSGTLLGTLNLGAAIPQNIDGNTFVPATGLSAGDGLLIVPAGNSINAFVLSTTP